jgi:hypothetical protein
VATQLVASRVVLSSIELVSYQLAGKIVQALVIIQTPGHTVT